VITGLAAPGMTPCSGAGFGIAGKRKKDRIGWLTFKRVLAIIYKPF